MLDSLLWWLLIELVGIGVWPVAFRFFRNLPDRGYAFIKPLGLLLIAYPFWILTTFGFLTNTRGAIALVAVCVAAASWWFFGKIQSIGERRPSIVGIERSTVDGVFDQASPITSYDSPLMWLQDNAKLVVVTELVFTLAFFAWVLVRAYMPEITATEKPMEFAFLNGVLQSDHFPPLDPWLSGYAISYYYFGYILVAMLALLSGVASSVAFNLAIALLFALAATGAFGLAYNLIQHSKWQEPRTAISGLQQMVFALFAPLFLLLAGNLEGFFEALHAKGIGSSDFWNWLDVKGLASAPTTNSFVPNDNWWWWRASRVVHDVVAGQTQEVIDEFPQFSFLLGDMHPHVLALPFVLLALAVALNLLKSKFELDKGRLNFRTYAVEWVLLPVVLGGLFFLNSWDILPYGFILLAAFAVARFRVENQWNSQVTRELAIFAVALGVSSVLLYLPFYISFQSQAGGPLPTLFVKTRLHQYLIMFGLFVFVLGAFLARLAFEYRRNRSTSSAGVSVRPWLSRIMASIGAIASFPIFVALLALVVIGARPDLQEQARAAFPGMPDNIIGNVVSAYFGPWFSDPWLFILLTVFLVSIIALVSDRLLDDSTTFALLLAFTGFLLTFGVEFVYLRDQFGTRMNTVFKFYFQTWALLSIAGAYAVFYLSRTLNGVARGVWFVGLALLLGASLVYPALAIPNRANNFEKIPELDGIAWIATTNPGDYAAIQWLVANAPRGAHILEAVGDDYSYGNRISMATGLATPLGWFGHESQWRGNTRLFKDDAAGIDRGADIARIYQTLDLPETLTLLGKYDISFVVVGQEERTKYGLTKSQIDKFGKVLTLVLDKYDVRIYARSN